MLSTAVGEAFFFFYFFKPLLGCLLPGRPPSKLTLQDKQVYLEPKSLGTATCGSDWAALHATHLLHLLCLLGSARDPREKDRRQWSVDGTSYCIMTQRDVREENIILVSDEES